MYIFVDTSKLQRYDIPHLSNRLEEVLAILGDTFPYEMISASLELPELQGEPEYVAAEKCKWAAEQVSYLSSTVLSWHLHSDSAVHT